MLSFAKKGGKYMKSMAELRYHYSIKLRIYPSDLQKQIIQINSDASRFIYNELIAIDKELCELRSIKLPIDTVKKRIQTLELRKNVRQMSNHYKFLEDKRIDSTAKDKVLHNYCKAWSNFGKKHRQNVPRFHRKSYVWKYQTSCHYGQKTEFFLTNGSVRFLDDKHLRLPKLEKIRIKGSHRRLLTRACETKIGTVTISKDAADRFYVSLQLASDTPFVNEFPKTKSQIGIDLNIDNFLTTSDGQIVKNPKYYEGIKEKLAKAQRKLNRRQLRAKKEGRKLENSKNYQKQRLLIAKLHAKVADRRHNFLHEVSTTLIKNHDLVVAEELRSKNLMKNHALAMRISDTGWRTFLKMLTYKAKMHGRQFITVDPKNTTQTCHNCQFVMGSGDTKKLTLDDRTWKCPVCEMEHIRDYNAAKNILAKGIQQLA